MVIPGPEVQAKVRPQETHHLLLYSGGRYFLHADGAGLVEALALSYGHRVAEVENEVTRHPLLIVPGQSNEMPPDRHMVVAKETTRATPGVVMWNRNHLG